MSRAIGYVTGTDRLELIRSLASGVASRFFGPKYYGARYFGPSYFR